MRSAHIAIHPAAEWFPLLPEDELDALAADIKENRLREKVAVITKGGRRLVIDDRNRLDALELAGFCIVDEHGRLRKSVCVDLTKGDDLDLVDPAKVEAFIISKNIHRRHLTTEQKADLIGKLLKANPERSDRAIAKLAHVDHKTVAAVRTEAEGSGEIPHIVPTERVDAVGRKRARKTANEAAKAERTEEQGEALKQRKERKGSAAKDQPSAAPVVAYEPAAPVPTHPTEGQVDAALHLLSHGLDHDDRRPQIMEWCSEVLPEPFDEAFDDVCLSIMEWFDALDETAKASFATMVQQEWEEVRPQPQQPALPAATVSFDAARAQFKTWYATLTHEQQLQVERAMGDVEAEQRAAAASPAEIAVDEAAD